jgi:hypothetical protein
MGDLTITIIALFTATAMLAAGGPLLRRRRKQSAPLPLARHRKRRDPYAPLHYDGSPAEQWLRGDDYRETNW